MAFRLMPEALVIRLTPTSPSAAKVRFPTEFKSRRQQWEAIWLRETIWLQQTE